MAFNGTGKKETPLENRLVIRTIFECLSTKQLVKVSGVTKLWNYEARCVLRDQRKCVAVIDGDVPCVKAKQLNEILPTLDVNFFSGLSIRMDKHGIESCLPRMRVEDEYENLVKMPWKSLKINWSREMTEDCLLGQFILRMMAKSSSLEHLIITEIPVGIGLKVENRPEGEFELPKLKSLQIPEAFRTVARKLLPSLLARAPSVELVNVIDPCFIPMMPVDSLKIIKKLRIPYVYHDGASSLMRSLDNFLASEPKLRELYAYGPRFRAGHIRMMQAFFERLAAVIYSSSETLRKLMIDSFSMYMLGVSVRAKLFPPVMENIENLTFDIDEGSEPGICRHLMKAPLAQMFPHLTSVTILTNDSQWNHREHEIEQAGIDISPWLATKKCHFECFGRCDVAIMELGTLFPNLQCLEICFLDEPPASCFPFRQIWSSLLFLEELTLSGELERNFDAEFCGIHPEEAALLRSKDDEYLKTVNIVPLFSPVSNVRGLKVVKVELESNTCFLSKVPVLITLGQRPNLEFRLRAPADVANHLEHLKPYFKLELRETE